MTAPTPDEITNALAVLRRIPGVRDIDSLGVIERANTPRRRMAADLHTWWTKSTGSPADLEIELRAAAERHGLRITTDPAPGEPLGYSFVTPCELRGLEHRWRIAGGVAYLGEAQARGDAAARSGGRAVAVYLLPEGGQQ